MNNFEKGNGGFDGGRATGWEHMDDDFDEIEKRRTRRYEAVKKSEKADLVMTKKAKTLAMAAFAAIAITGAVLATNCSTSEVMENERTQDRIETIENVESVTLHGGPNVRTDPRVTSKNDAPNVIVDTGGDESIINIAYDGAVYRYDSNGVNGDWYGFNAEEFAEDLIEGAYIKDADGFETDQDGVVWVNEKYVTVEKSDSE